MNQLEQGLGNWPAAQGPCGLARIMVKGDTIVRYAAWDNPGKLVVHEDPGAAPYEAAGFAHYFPNQPRNRRTGVFGEIAWHRGMGRWQGQIQVLAPNANRTQWTITAYFVEDQWHDALTWLEKVVAAEVPHAELLASF